MLSSGAVLIDFFCHKCGAYSRATLIRGERGRLFE